jgi:hypothetical protein
MEYIKEILLDAGAMNGIYGVVIHNDAGSMNGKQYVEWLKNRDLELGIAHWYIDRNYSAQVIKNTNVGWHTANPEGNGHYIGYEVCESMSTSDEDFLKNEEEVFRQVAKDMKILGITPTRNTVRLHKEFSKTTCPHRSWDLHGKSVNSVKDYFISRIQNYIDNPDTPGSGTSQSSGNSTVTKPENSDTPSTTSGVASTTASAYSGHIWRYNDFGFSLGQRTQKQGQQNTSVNTQIQDSGNSSPNGSTAINTGQIKGKASQSVSKALNPSNWNSLTDGGVGGIDVDGAFGAQCFDLANYYMMNMDIGWDRTDIDTWLNYNFILQYKSQFERLGWKIIEHPTFKQLSIGAITFENDQGVGMGDIEYGGHTEMITSIEGNLVSFLTQNPASPNIVTIDTGGKPRGSGYAIQAIAIPPNNLVR